LLTWQAKKKQNNRFKKPHFLNRLIKITDLKSASKGRVQKIQHCKGRVKRKKIIRGKNKTRPHYRRISTYLPKKNKIKSVRNGQVTSDINVKQKCICYYEEECI
jgi:hypothetical protein